MCAVAGTLILTAAGTATGAEGVLIINDTSHENPSGCVPVADEPSPLQIINDTGAVATVYLEAGCAGAITERVVPGSDIEAFGSSIRIE
ncbi:hypothetical protein GV794_10040 [Nocardia cyriacigeorgica]|uniref:Secreted protein n=1 Tax=Nocardia cyriacigeorgica TaxID=135487 RepID=A0A6P1CYG3_9NOCA|nr:hypothetical protein [Nocardia cyriacigeorgica]NEW39226.1 hypothetical protein [Nocardia cyriacigeorgica]NEW43156.1 hypothetical protein [Nocardia cyriacigeorgica]NEW49730.1 hypothetical protein [Nocardia cyriacigeorgica]NEW55989.1 hypothetical protein [Nocardia cyriacigeorgica]